MVPVSDFAAALAVPSRTRHRQDSPFQCPHLNNTMHAILSPKVHDQTVVACCARIFPKMNIKNFAAIVQGVIKVECQKMPSLAERSSTGIIRPSAPSPVLLLLPPLFEGASGYGPPLVPILTNPVSPSRRNHCFPCHLQKKDRLFPAGKPKRVNCAYRMRFASTSRSCAGSAGEC